MKANARFWVLTPGGGYCKVTLHPGQKLNHQHHGHNGEGWTSAYESYEYTGNMVLAVYETDGTDCDGRSSFRGESWAHIMALESGNDLGDGTGIRFPKWNAVSRSQRDYAAERAGY